MPKLKPSPLEETYRILRAHIAGNQERYAITDEFLASRLGISVSTFKKRKTHPGTFTLNELHLIAKHLKFTPVQAASIALGRDITAKEVKDFILM